MWIILVSQRLPTPCRRFGPWKLNLFPSAVLALRRLLLSISNCFPSCYCCICVSNLFPILSWHDTMLFSHQPNLLSVELSLHVYVSLLKDHTNSWMVKSKISAGESGSKARLHKESDALKEATIFACSNWAGGGVSFIKVASETLRFKAVQSISNVVTVSHYPTRPASGCHFCISLTRVTVACLRWHSIEGGTDRAGLKELFQVVWNWVKKLRLVNLLQTIKLNFFTPYSLNLERAF